MEELFLNLYGETIFFGKKEEQKSYLFRKKEIYLFMIQFISYEKQKGRKSNLKYFKVWGCLDKVQDSIPKSTKVGSIIMDSKNRFEQYSEGPKRS